MRAIDAMFVWTPDREGFETKLFPLKGQINVTTIPESDYTRKHPMSFGACDCYWDETDDCGRRQMMQRLIIELIYDDNIPVAEVRSAVMQVEEFAAFPFCTELPSGWETADNFSRSQMAERLVTKQIHEDNIREAEVRRAFIQVDEFPFSAVARRRIEQGT